MLAFAFAFAFGYGFGATHHGEGGRVRETGTKNHAPSQPCPLVETGCGFPSPSPNPSPSPSPSPNPQPATRNPQPEPEPATARERERGRIRAKDTAQLRCSSSSAAPKNLPRDSKIRVSPGPESGRSAKHVGVPHSADRCYPVGSERAPLLTPPNVPVRTALPSRSLPTKRDLLAGLSPWPE